MANLRRYFVSYPGMPVLPGDVVTFDYPEGSTHSRMVAMGTFTDHRGVRRVAVAFYPEQEPGHYGLASHCRVVRRAGIAMPRLDLAGDFKRGWPNG